MIKDDITVDGVTYGVEELFERRLLVNGVQPTDYDQWKFLDVLVSHKNRKADAMGTAQAIYRHSDLTALNKWHEYEYPYYIDVVMTTIVDKKGNQIQQILVPDFDSVKEMELVPRKLSNVATVNTATKSQQSAK